MRREQTLEEILDGKLYDSNDMVKADSHNCRNVRNLNLFVVNRFYIKPYDQNQDFYI